MGRRELGAVGEQLATEFLISQGLKLLGQNIRVKLGEIDILMEEGSTIVVVEVKTQQRATLIDPIYKITPAKQRKLRQLALVMSTRYPTRNIRIDAVTVYWGPDREAPYITHYPNIL